MEHKVPLNDYNYTCLKPEKITDLPDDVMIMIFKYLTPSERLRTSTVCNKWLQLVNEFFSKDHCIVLTENIDFSPTGSICKTFSNRLKTTKHMRSFSHLIIKFFPKNAPNLSNVHNFIELIGNEVKCFVIEDEVNPQSAENWYNNNLYAKMPNLESLEVSSTIFLQDLSPATNLKTIKVKSTFKDLKILSYCRGIKNIESLTAGSIAIMKEEIDDESLTSFMEPNTKEILKQVISSEITLKSNFNFCSETKFSVDDVSMMEIENCDKPIPANILRKFQNLKKLMFRSKSIYRPLVLTKNRVTYSGISHLKLDGSPIEVPPHFDNLLQSFPDLECLSIYYYPLKDDQFFVICQFMPKLKELVLRNSQISFEAVLGKNKYCLKNLLLLEKLDIETKAEIVSGINYTCPVLPNLKELRLEGKGFKYKVTNGIN